MTTLGLVDEQQRGMVASFPAFNPEQDDLAEFRRALVEGTTELLQSAAARFEERIIPGPKGAPDVRIILFRPVDVQGVVPVILNIHGGGMIAGTPDMQAGTLERLAADTAALVVSVDYRWRRKRLFPVVWRIFTPRWYGCMSTRVRLGQTPRALWSWAIAGVVALRRPPLFLRGTAQR